MGDEQCCDRFRWTAMGLSHTYSVYPFSPPPQTPLPSRLPHNPEQSSLRLLVGCYFKYSRVCMSIPGSLTIPSPLATISSFS